MASLRDRAEALLEEVGLESSGKLASDVNAVADALGVEIGAGASIADTIAFCELETTTTVHNDVTPTPRVSPTGAPETPTPAETVLAAAAPMPAAPAQSEPTSLTVSPGGAGCVLFWDLAGCRPGGAASGGADAGIGVVRSVASLYGDVKSARAYGDIAGLSSITRISLQDAGVLLIDTGSDDTGSYRGGGLAATTDRSPIIVDLFDYALDHAANRKDDKAPVLVVALGGAPREQFGLAFARLAERGFKSALIRPRDSPCSRYDGGCIGVHDWASIKPDNADTVPLCFKCGWRNCPRVHPRRCSAHGACALCGETSHTTHYHNEFAQYVSRSAAEKAEAQVEAAAAQGLAVPHDAARINDPFGRQPQVPQATPITSSTDFSMSGSSLSVAASLWRPAATAAPAPLLEPRDVVPPRRTWQERHCAAYVTGVPVDMRVDRLRTIFEAYGPVLTVEPLPIRFRGSVRSAIVVFGDVQSLDRAIHAAPLCVDGARLGVRKSGDPNPSAVRRQARHALAPAGPAVPAYSAATVAPSYHEQLAQARARGPVAYTPPQMPPGPPPRRRGVCQWFDPTKKHGFIKPDDGDADLFVHWADLRADTAITEGDAVEFATANYRGGLKAVHVTKVDPAPAPSSASFAPPPPPWAPSPTSAYSEASYERLVAELAEVKCAPSEGAMQILKQQEVTVEDLCDLTHAMLVATGVEPIDVHKIWSKIEVLRNRKIARDAAGIGGIP